MSDAKSTPMASTLTGNQAPNKQSAPNQFSTNNQSTSGVGGETKGGGRRKWGGGNAGGSTQNNADDYSDSGSINRRGKRPEVQHYKPPGASKKGDEYPPYGSTHEYEINNLEETPKSAGGGGNRRPNKGRGKRGGHYNNQYQHSGIHHSQQNDLDDTSRKVKSLSIEDENIKYQTEGHFHKGGLGGKRKKKPEQLHYIPKKAVTGNDVSGAGSLESNLDKDAIPTEGKQQDDKEAANKQNAKFKDQYHPSPGKVGMESITMNNREENIPKEEKYGSTKKNRYRTNRKEGKKDYRDEGGQYEQTQEKKNN